MRHWLPLLIGVLLLPPTGRAAPVSVAFEGMITSIIDEFGLLPAVAAGDPYSGTYFYDDAVAATTCADPFDSRPLDQCATYTFPQQMSAGMTLELGGKSYAFLDTDDPLVPLTITTLDESSRDRFWARWERGDPERDDSLSLDLFDFASPPASFLETTDLHVPSLSPDAQFSYRPHFIPPRVVIVNGRVQVLPGTESSVTGIITSLHVTPEPTASPLLLLFVLAMGIQRRPAGRSLVPRR